MTRTQASGAAKVSLPAAPDGTPFLVRACVSELYKRGLQAPLIFESKVRRHLIYCSIHIAVRASQASARDVMKAKASCEATQGTDMSREDPHVVANLLLLYFREMPQPLLEFKLYDQWVQALGETMDPSPNHVAF